VAGQERPIPSFSSDATHVSGNSPVRNEIPLASVAIIKTLVGLGGKVNSTFTGPNILDWLKQTLFNLRLGNHVLSK
jgi:hypothetical protein